MEKVKAFLSVFCAAVKKYALIAWEFIKKWAPVVWSKIVTISRNVWAFLSEWAVKLWVKGKALTARLLGLDEIADNKAVTITMLSFILNILLLLIVIL